MKFLTSRLLLGSSLIFLFIAILLKWQGAVWLLWLPVLILAIFLKVGFLATVIRAKDFRIGVWLALIIVGVILIFVSLVFKYLYPIVWLRNTLFYGAIFLKITGVGLKLKEERN